MSTQGVLYLIAIILIAVSAFPLRVRGISLALLGAAVALLAYAWPVLTNG